MRTIKSIRLPRKLKKDVIKVCGRENYYKIMFMMRLRYRHRHRNAYRRGNMGRWAVSLA